MVKLQRKTKKHAQTHGKMDPNHQGATGAVKSIQMGQT